MVLPFYLDFRIGLAFSTFDSPALRLNVSNPTFQLGYSLCWGIIMMWIAVNGIPMASGY
jgi:hypothetical protein